MSVPKLGLILLILGMLGCAAPQRYLSEEEEAQMAKICGPNHDCAVVPGEQWRIIEKVLQQYLGI